MSEDAAATEDDGLSASERRIFEQLVDTGKLCMGEGYTSEVIRNLMYGIIDSLDSVSSDKTETLVKRGGRSEG